MRLVVKQKIINFGGKYFIKDRNDQDLFYVKGTFFAIPKRYRVFDMAENELIMLKKKLFHIMAHFVLIKDGNVVAKIKRRFAFGNKYDIEGADGTNYTLEGNLLDWDYDIKKNGNTVATVFKKLTLYRDSYIIDIEDEAELPVVIALTVMFDHQHHRRNNDNH